MRVRPLCNKLNEFLEVGLEAGVFLAIQHHTVTDGGVSRSLAPTSRLGMVRENGITAHDYLSILNDSTFSAIFSDCAVLSLECRFSPDERMQAHRYHYIPCPIRPELMADRSEPIAIADWVENVIETHQVNAVMSVGTYRFDFSVDMADDDELNPHPLSHLTFASQGCRIPLRAPLSPSSFLRFTFENFYRRHEKHWYDFAPHLRCLGDEPSIRVDELERHHISWTS